MRSLKDSYTLSNGVRIPCVGFGTYLSKQGSEAFDAVVEALRVGYRHIDTASLYGNEKSVGDAVRASGVDRKEVFVTSKVWNTDQGYESTLRAFDKTLDKLGFDYLDLYLIHWPRGAGREDEWPTLNRQTWQAMEGLYRDGRIKAIGVSNFKPHHIVSLMEMSMYMPMVNQIELHPGVDQSETVEFCRENNILVESWAPFSRGAVFGSGMLDDIAARHGKTVAQVCLRWHLQQELLPLPKSVTPARIAENADIFDFHLSHEDMDHIDSLGRGIATTADPDKVAY